MNITQEIKDKVWTKGRISNKFPGGEYRLDDYGYWMKYSDHGNRNSAHGWEIDHIIPESKGGSDDISNLRPLYWENNAKKQDGKL